MQYRFSESEIYAHRPKPFFFLNTRDAGEYTREKTEESLKALKECGFSGFVLFNKPPTGFDKESYLSDTWFAAVENFAVSARGLSLEMWINDGFDYPPGDVGGRVHDIDPTLKQKRICLEKGELVVKEADWGFPAFENPKAWQIYNELVYREYEKRIKQYFGNPIKGFFSDADNRRVQPAVMFDKKHPCNDYFPWADGFREGFKTRYGYDIIPHMKDVLERKDVKEAEDYWECAGNLYQSWFKKNAEWLHGHGLLYTGHTTDTSPFLYKDGPRSSCFTEGRFSDLEGIFDYPGTDQELLAIDGGKHVRVTSWYTPKAVWGNKIHTQKMKDYTRTDCDLRAKQAYSTAVMYKKKGVMCEMFAATNFGVSPSELKHIAAYQIMQGVTFAVVHAYHYRFFGPTKYFAPPEFSERGLLGKSVKELNAHMARLCAMFAKGENVTEVALVAPTEAVWRNRFEEQPYYNAFQALNRLPYGFFVCGKEKLLSEDYGVKAAVIAGFEPEAEFISALEKKGITVISGGETDRLKTLIKPAVSYSGEGHPHFAKKVIDGEEFIFIANIESVTPVTGVIKAYGREKRIKLYPGDVRYISPHYDDIPVPPKTAEKTFDIPLETEAEFTSPNLIPLEYFIGGDGTAATKEEEGNLSFFFDCAEGVETLSLYIPAACFEKGLSVIFDGQPLKFCNDKVYDEEYRSAKFEGGKGAHELKFIKERGFAPYDRVFMTGAFDCDVKADCKEYKHFHSFYNLDLFIPEKAKVTLYSRQNRLRTDKPWSEQGQPFYSGEGIYRFTAEFNEGANYMLTLPKVRDACELYINGKFEGKKVFYPYEFEFYADAGKAEFEIRVTNSLANAFECYLEDGGIFGGGKIEKIKG